MDSEDSNQTGRMPRLICVFAGRTAHFVSIIIHFFFANFQKTQTVMEPRGNMPAIFVRSDLRQWHGYAAMREYILERNLIVVRFAQRRSVTRRHCADM